jgi:hypothetical protein
VQYRNGAGATSAVVSDTIGLDTVAPTVNLVHPALAVGKTITTTGLIPVKLTWGGSDATSGICSFTIQRSDNGGAFANVSLPTPTTTTITQNLTSGTSYKYRSMSTDCAGNASAFKTAAAFTPTLIQQGAAGITYSAGWTVVSDANASGGSLKQSIAAGKTALVHFTGFAVGYVARRDSASGNVSTSIDGGAATTVNLNSASTIERRMPFTKNGLSNAAHTLLISNLGTAGHPNANVDAIVFLH